MFRAPHKEEVVRGLEFTGRQVAWSTGGEWCVVVGSAAVVAIFERWGGVA
jgi:polycomb protein EED